MMCECGGLKEQNVRLRKALNDILTPLSYLMEEARKSGCVLNGNAASLMESPVLYKEIAAEALRVHSSCPESRTTLHKPG